jgi:hypothetical protein
MIGLLKLPLNLILSLLIFNILIILKATSQLEQHQNTRTRRILEEHLAFFYCQLNSSSMRVCELLSFFLWDNYIFPMNYNAFSLYLYGLPFLLSNPMNYRFGAQNSIPLVKGVNSYSLLVILPS